MQLYHLELDIPLTKLVSVLIVLLLLTPLVLLVEISVHLHGHGHLHGVGKAFHLLSNHVSNKTKPRKSTEVGSNVVSHGPARTLNPLDICIFKFEKEFKLILTAWD